MIRIVRIQIGKEQFRTLLKDERALLLLMGHALNQTRPDKAGHLFQQQRSGRRY